MGRLSHSRLDGELKVTKDYDRRIKLTDQDRAEIRELYKMQEWSTRKLAAKYDVSKRLIELVLDPAKAIRQNELYRERQLDGRYYDKEKHRVYMQSYREHKKELIALGKLKPREAHEGLSNCDDKVCVVCEKQLPSLRRYNMVYCSKKCRWKAASSRKSDA